MRTWTIQISMAVVAGALAVAFVQVQGGREVARGDQRRDHMVMTVLEAHVEPEHWAALQQSYEARATVLPPQIVESFLAQSATDSTLWRIVTVWRSREALEEMRQSGETPTGVLIFRDARADPSLTIFTIRANPRAAVDPLR